MVQLHSLLAKDFDTNQLRPYRSLAGTAHPELLVPVHYQGTHSALVHRQLHPRLCGFMIWLAREARQPDHKPVFSPR